MDRLKRALLVLAILIASVGLIVTIEAFFPPYEDDFQVNGQATFVASEVPFHFTPSRSTYPFTGASVIDIDNDGSYEVFIGGGKDQDDVLLHFQPLSLEDSKRSVITSNIIADTGLSSRSATYGSSAIDADNDGDTDLFVARASGVFYYENTGGRFSQHLIDAHLEPDAVPVDVSVSDINGDGLVDLYVSTFISNDKFKSVTFNDPAHRTINTLLVNRGNMSFEDITASSGAMVDQNTFTASFADLDNDGFEDLVVSTNTDSVKMFQNLGNETFQSIDTPDYLGTWMGIGLSDIDSDGDTDVFFSNMGTFAPEFLLRGDLEKSQQLHQDWLLLENSGNLSFKDITAEQNLVNKEFAWGAVFTDTNLDGRQDLIVAENYVKWPLHKLVKSPGRLFTQDTAGNFVSTTKSSALVNKAYGFAPIVFDANQDGAPDVLMVNIDSPSKLFLNSADNADHAVRVVLPDSISALGATVSATTTDNQTLTQRFHSKQGIMSDQSSELFFGFEKYEGNVTITITLNTGQVVAREVVSVASTVRFTPQ